MIGVNEMDFSDYDDKCVELLKEKVLRIKLTTCDEGFFTCDDGQCIDIETRCDQSPNCKSFKEEGWCSPNASPDFTGRGGQDISDEISDVLSC